MFKLEITTVCNHRCFYCYKDNFCELDNKNMTIEQFDYILNKLEIEDPNISIGRYNSFNITGGEPFCNFEVLVHIIKKLKEKSYKFGINSNLTMNQKLLERLWEETKISNKDTPLGLFVSVPSLNNEIFKKIVKVDTCDNLIENIKYIINNKDKYGITANIVVSKYNYDETLDTIKKLLMLGVNKVKVNRAHKFTVGKELYISDEELILLYDKILEFEKENNNLNFHGATSCMPMCLFPNEEKYTRFHMGCSAANDISINPDGNVKACVEFPLNYMVGNIFEDSIINLRKKNKEFCTFKEEDYAIDCPQCELYKKNTCMGGCKLEHLLCKEYNDINYLSLDNKDKVYNNKENLLSKNY